MNTSLSANFNSMQENYDTSNPIIANILKAKEDRLKILQELNKQNQEELHETDLSVNNFKRGKKAPAKKNAVSRSNEVEFPCRRSTRLQNSPAVKYTEPDDYKPQSVKRDIIRPPLDYGEVPGVEVGFHWETRMECSQYGVHRPTVAGIHGGPDGAYSIALSGGYPEDVDEGDTFIYTGAGGRELKGTATKPKNLRTAPQTKDQQLEGTNLSLVRSIETKLPIRVIRGYKSPSIFAPETGYRYDGLYQVVGYWEDVGQTGYRVYRFKMERMKGQAPPPWEANAESLKNILRETDFKENVLPVDNSPEKMADSLRDVDKEIEKCIKYVANAAVANSLKLGSDEGEFRGWD